MTEQKRVLGAGMILVLRPCSPLPSDNVTQAIPKGVNEKEERYSVVRILPFVVPPAHCRSILWRPRHRFWVSDRRVPFFTLLVYFTICVYDEETRIFSALAPRSASSFLNSRGEVLLFVFYH